MAGFLDLIEKLKKDPLGMAGKAIQGAVSFADDALVQDLGGQKQTLTGSLRGIGQGINAAGTSLQPVIRNNPTLNNAANQLVTSDWGKNIATPFLTGLASTTMGATGLDQQYLKQRDAVQGNSTFNLFGKNPFMFTGEIAGDPTTYLPFKAATLPGKIASGVALGGLSGAITPARDQYERNANIALGGLTGGAIPAAGPALKFAAKDARAAMGKANATKLLDGFADRIPDRQGMEYAYDTLWSQHKAGFRDDMRAVAKQMGMPEQFQKMTGNELKEVMGYVLGKTDGVSAPVKKKIQQAAKDGSLINRFTTDDGGFINPDLLTGGLNSKVEQATGDKLRFKTTAPDPQLNMNRLNIAGSSKAQLAEDTASVAQQVQGKTGERVTFNEVLENAAQSSRQLSQMVSREDTVKFQSALLNARKAVADAASKGEVTKEYLDALRAVSTVKSDLARKFGSLRINADPANVRVQNQVIEALQGLGFKADEILEAAKGKNLNDAATAKDLYRQFVAPTTGEYVDALRYSSMLSSPNTHINNASANVLSTGVGAPIEKTVAGGLDWLASAVNPGRERTRLAGEGAAYAKGYVGELNNALTAFKDVMNGTAQNTNLDMNQIPLGNNPVAKTLEFVPKLLEASDQFFTALTKAGETSALTLRQAGGLKVKGNIEELAGDSAAYRLFRDELHKAGQGHVLDAVDTLTGTIQKLRSSKNPVVGNVAKWTLPFVKTPMNILKQGIEYSPAGVSTLWGSEDKLGQLAKTVMGTSAMVAISTMVSSGQSTWAAPTSAKERDAFYAAGKQPYSVKVGDNWIAYNKLPPYLAFNFALLSAIHDAQDNGRMGDTEADTLLSGVAKWGNFVADQSYFKSIGDLIGAVQGGPDGMSRMLSNYPTQVIPFRALLGWVTRLTDDTQRKVDYSGGLVDQVMQQVAMNIPGLAQKLQARTDSAGNPLVAQNPVLNAFSPVRVTTEDPQRIGEYNGIVDNRRFNADYNALKDKEKDGNITLSDQEKLQSLDVQKTIKSWQSEIKKLSSMPAGGSLQQSRFVEARTKVAKDIAGSILDGDVSSEIGEKYISSIGFKPEEVEYLMAKDLNDDDQASYAWEKLNAGTNWQELVDNDVLTASVAKKLYQSGNISEDQYKGLTTSINASKGTTKKPKKLSISIKRSSASSPKLVSMGSSSVKITAPKFKKITA